MLLSTVVRLLSPFVLTALLLSPSCSRAADIRIGMLIDEFGINADLGKDYIAGARTYFDHINSRGGINGRKITLVVKDDGGNAANAVSLTREFIDKEKVDLLFGYIGDDSIAQVAKDAAFRNSGIALFAPLSGMELGEAGDNIVFVRPSYNDEVRHIIQHFSQLFLSQFVVVHVDTNFGTALAREVRAQLQARNKQLAGTFSFPPSLAGLDGVVKSVIKSQAQVVIIAGDTIATAEFVKKMRALETGTNIVGLSLVNHRTLMELAKADAAAGTMLTQVVPNPLANTTRLQSEHLSLMAKYRDEPPSHLTLEGFMAAKALVRALGMVAGDLNRTTIAKTLAGSRRLDLEGMTLAFDKANDRGSRFVDIAYLRKTGRLVQ
jgi:ABC-type branched-subunit amino acid transport system substrate-binding protein